MKIVDLSKPIQHNPGDPSFMRVKIRHRPHRKARWLLRLFGIATLCAIPAIFMPRSWMDWCHRRIGLGPLPEGVIVDYLARSLSAFYAILGGILLICAHDIRRYSAIITYIATGWTARK